MLSLDSCDPLCAKGRAVVSTGSYPDQAEAKGPSLPGSFHADVYLRELHGGGLELTVANLVAGATADLRIEGASPGGLIVVGLSTAGQGPYVSYWGTVDLSPPLHALTLVRTLRGSFKPACRWRRRCRAPRSSSRGSTSRRRRR